jgi:hypothetical protein
MDKDRKDRFFSCVAFKMTEKTLHQFVLFSWLWLIENDEAELVKYRKLRENTQVAQSGDPSKPGVYIRFKRVVPIESMVSIIETPDGSQEVTTLNLDNRWRRELIEWLQAPQASAHFTKTGITIGAEDSNWIDGILPPDDSFMWKYFAETRTLMVIRKG